MNPTELREKSYKLVLEAREHLEKGDAEGDAKHDQIMAEADALEARAVRAEALNAREAAFNEAVGERPTEARSVERAETRSKDEIRTAALDAHLRGRELNAEQRAAVMEMRAQSVGTAGAGGYLVPQSWASNIITAMKAYGPMIDVGSQLVTSDGGLFNLPTADDTSNVGALLTENTAAGEQDVAFGNVQLGAYKYTSKMIKVSRELLQDSAFDLVGHITNQMAVRVGRIVNTHLTTGDGSSKPQGLFAGLTSGLTSAANTDITTDELLSLMHSVDPAYRNAQCKWMFNDATLLNLKKKKDATSGQYIWQPGLQAGEAGSLFGYGYVINQDVASIATTTKAVAFGDFAQAYTVRRVRDLQIVRMDERFGEYDQVAFVGFMRIDGKVTNANAAKVLTVKT